MKFENKEELEEKVKNDKVVKKEIVIEDEWHIIPTLLRVFLVILLAFCALVK